MITSITSLDLHELGGWPVEVCSLVLSTIMGLGMIVCMCNAALAATNQKNLVPLQMLHLVPAQKIWLSTQDSSSQMEKHAGWTRTRGPR